MISPTKVPDPTSPWAPYSPTKEAPWDLRRVVHLHRRAGFAATWGEIQRDLKDGPAASIDRVLSGKSRSQGVPEELPEAFTDDPRVRCFEQAHMKYVVAGALLYLLLKK